VWIYTQSNITNWEEAVQIHLVDKLRDFYVCRGTLIELFYR
jgi:hypothetical protein